MISYENNNNDSVSTIPHKIFENFVYFSIVSVHHKQNAYYYQKLNVRVSSQVAKQRKTDELRKQRNSGKNLKLSAGIVYCLVSIQK